LCVPLPCLPSLDHWIYNDMMLQLGFLRSHHPNPRAALQMPQSPTGKCASFTVNDVANWTRQANAMPHCSQLLRDSQMPCCTVQWQFLL
jgi:hypothetical protein